MKVKILHVIGFVLGCGVVASAQSIPPTDNSETILNKEHGTPGRPRTPSEDFILCHYGSGWIDFVFPESVESVDAVLYQYNIPVWQGEANVSSTCVDIPIVYGECTLTCTSQNGVQYSGNLYFRKSENN